MLSESEIKEILIQQRQAILNKKYGVERAVLKEVEAKIKLPHIVVLTGLRRSGKSTLLRQLMQKQYQDKDFYYLNFEDERLFNFPAQEFNKLYEGLIALYGKQNIFFIDEIQNIARFETFLRRLYEEGIKFFITGSSATLLSKELGTRLTGRHVDIIVRPFSFQELLELKGVKISPKSLYQTEEKIQLKKYFEEYLFNGGMPEYLIYNDPELLVRVYEDTILKDIAIRYKVNNIVNLKQLYTYLLSNCGNKFSYNSLKKFTSIHSVNTIKKFIFYLEETYFARTINKFDYSYKKQIINDKKFYIVDNGFTAVLSQKVTKNYGWLLENLVFNTLNKEGEVFYYAGENECDFLLIKNKDIKKAVQVCFELNQENKERELAGLTEAMIKCKLNEGLLLTNNQEEAMILNKKKIIVKPVWKWLLEQS